MPKCAFHLQGSVWTVIHVQKHGQLGGRPQIMASCNHQQRELQVLQAAVNLDCESLQSACSSRSLNPQTHSLQPSKFLAPASVAFSELHPRPAFLLLQWMTMSRPEPPSANTNLRGCLPAFFGFLAMSLQFRERARHAHPTDC